MKRLTAAIGLALVLACGTVFAGTIQVPRTGQGLSYATGDDGDLQKGVVWPSPRFIDNGNGTLSDNLTGLVWAKDASVPTFEGCTGGLKTWAPALTYVACLNSVGYLGFSDWRMPNLNEMESLADASKNNSNGLATIFTGMLDSYYWTSTSVASNPNSYAWTIYVSDASLSATRGKTSASYVLPIRGGN